MSDFVIGIPIGIAIGVSIRISIGIAIEKNQKPWSELTEGEKKTRKIAIGAGSVILLLGFIVFLWLLLN